MYNNRHTNLTYEIDGNLSLNMDKNWGDSIINNNEYFIINNLSSLRQIGKFSKVIKSNHTSLVKYA